MIFKKTKKIKQFKLIFMVILILIICGFTAGEFVKTFVAKEWWDFYQDDFSWVKKNIPKDKAVYYPCQTLSYHIHRFTPRGPDFEPGNYIWVNEEYDIEACGQWPDDIVKQIQDSYSLIYENNKTGTRIYEVKIIG